ncbi:nb-arc and ankyrin domain [Trichoderma arundinaceum]|uniref:Nb-arc and ankyrin domain n=1 Tax=Trichoderma arundinaceum TaxID=490622 RepID=A0A395NLC1_TRIAR|nr:nb-arc and ankyrin domain [Trichoderma arundinaceum]
MQNRLHTISNPLYSTCTWLSRVGVYANWISREKIDEHHGLLQIVGKPGSGKSTIMKQTFEQVRSACSGTTTCVAGFFFNKRGTSLEHSSLGMFRSLLHQLLQCHPLKLPALMKLQEQELQEQDDGQISGLYLPSLRDVFQELFLDQQNDIRTIIFVDALDECDEPGSRDIAYFFRQLTDSAYSAGVQLDVCLSRRDFPTVFLRDCPDVKLEMFTRCDIEHYISKRFEVAGFGDSDTIKEIRSEIADKANGIFLWVVLVVDEIIKEKDNGRNEMYLLGQIRRLPAQLDSLFTELLDLHKMSRSKLQITLRLFQWAVLSTSPLRLQDGITF